MLFDRYLIKNRYLIKTGMNVNNISAYTITEAQFLNKDLLREEQGIMESKRAEQIMQSNGVIEVSYNGMPVWIESIHGDMARVKFIDIDRSTDVPISALSEAPPMQTM
jgi:H-type small acid-soluble spore protein